MPILGNLSKTYAFLYKILKIVLAIFTNLTKIWLFFAFLHLRIWPFLKLLMAKFGFLELGNPVIQCKFCEALH